MEQAFYVVIGVLILFTVVGIIGILIEPLLRDKEPQA
jgi:uncharacterized membrane protein YbaN (DUF454 family)